MKRVHVETEDGQVADILADEFQVEHNGYDRWPTVTITGCLTKLGKREPQAPELMVVDVIYNDPATVIYWSDKTKTVVKCQPGDTYDPKIGFLLALCKKVCGNTGNFNDLLRECVPGYGDEKTQTEPSVEQMRKELSRFCRSRHCEGCPMHKNGFECGRGKFFTYDVGDRAYMTDESIVKHYRAMKGAKS